MPHLSVIMAYPHRTLLGAFLDTYVGVKMLGCEVRVFQDWLEAVNCLTEVIDSTCSKCLWLMSSFCAWAVEIWTRLQEITDPDRTQLPPPTVLHSDDALQLSWGMSGDLTALGTFQLNWWGCEISEASWLLVKLRTESWWICRDSQIWLHYLYCHGKHYNTNIEAPSQSQIRFVKNAAWTFCCCCV